MNKRVQIVRALSIIAVVMIHTNATGIVGVLSRPILNFCVAMFVFVSGYLTKLDIPDVRTFYKKRIKKVFVPYFLWSMIYIIASGNTDKMLLKLLTGTATAPFYYIFVYIQLVLLTPAIAKMLKSKCRWVGWTLTPVSVVILMYVLPYYGVTVEFPVYSINFLVWFIYYYLGMILGNNLTNFHGMSIRNLICAYFVAIAFSEIEGFFWYLRGNVNMATTQIRLTSIGTSIATILIAYEFIKKRDEIKDSVLTKAFLELGNCSFGVYLSHMAVISVLGHFSIYANIPFPINSLVVIGVSTICVLIGKNLLGKRISCLLGI